MLSAELHRIGPKMQPRVGRRDKPHLTESFKLSPDPQFIDKVRDIVGLYANPPEGALVLQPLAG